MESDKRDKYYTIEAGGYTVGMAKFEIVIKIDERQVKNSGYIRMMIKRVIETLSKRFIKFYWCERDGDGEITHLKNYGD